MVDTIVGAAGHANIICRARANSQVPPRSTDEHTEFQPKDRPS
jgi:hypothetical protein